MAWYTFNLVVREIPLLSQTFDHSLPNALLAFSVLQVTSSSVFTCYARLEVGFARIWLEHNLSFFFVVMVRPKLSQAVQNLSMLSCMLCSLVTFRAQSSANWKSLMTVCLTFITAFRWC